MTIDQEPLSIILFGFEVPLFIIAQIIFFYLVTYLSMTAIHELARLYTARKMGVVVKSFSLGIGPELIGFTDRVGTRWKISWIPIFSYTNCIWREQAAKSIKHDKLQELISYKQLESMNAKSFWQKALIRLAGPLAFLLLAYSLQTIYWYLTGEQYPKPIIGQVIENSPAQRAGFKKDDKIVSINQIKIKKFSEISPLIQRIGLKKTELDVLVQREENKINLKITPKLNNQNGIKRLTIGIASSSKLEHHQHQELNLLKASKLSLDIIYSSIRTAVKDTYYEIINPSQVSKLSGPVGIAHGGIRKYNYNMIALISFVSLSWFLYSLILSPLTLITLMLILGRKK